MPSPLNLRGTISSLLAPRVDAAPVPPMPHVVDEPRADSSTGGAAVANILSKLGSSRDSGASARPNVDRQALTDQEILALYESTAFGRIVDIMPAWATRKGISITDTSDSRDPLRTEMRTLGVMRAVREAAKWGRMLGEGAIWLSLDDGRPLDQPLVPSRVRRVHALHVLDKRDFTPARWEADPRSPLWGEPSHYHLHPQRAAGATSQPLVHASRLLVFHGHRLPPSYRQGRNAGRSLSIAQRLWDSLRNLEQMGAAGARAAQEISVAMFQIASLDAKGGGDAATSLTSKLTAINIAKSMANAVVLGTDDNYSRVPLNPSGFKDLSEFAQRHVAMVVGVPLVLLYGQAPAGLSTDGESWWRNWTAAVEDYQANELGGHVETIVECLYWASAGATPDRWEVAWNPLSTPTPKELAELRKLETEADSIAIMDGVMSREQAASRYGADGWSQEIQPPEDEEAPGSSADQAALDSARLDALLTRLDELAAKRDEVSASSVVLWLPVPEEAWSRIYAPTQAAVESVVGPMAQQGAPHLTMLYLGELSPAEVAEVGKLAAEIAASVHPFEVRPGSVVPLGPEGALVQEAMCWEGRDLNETLLRRLAHLVKAPQWARFRPHVTLGYAPSATPEQLADAMAAAPVHDAGDVPLWTATRLELVVGDVRRGVYPFLGRRHDEADRGEE